MTTSAKSKQLTTRGGLSFHVRIAVPSDEPALAAFFTQVTREDMRFRFLSTIKDVGQQRLHAMTHGSHHQNDNFLAFAQDGGDIIASAMLACDDNRERGEVAIVIRPEYKNRGVGWELLAFIARRAETMGLQTLESIESRDNHAAIELERETGFVSSIYPGDSSLMLLQRSLG